MSEKRLLHEIPKSEKFHSAILTTFSFDFYFFESQVLRQLKQKGITNVSVFADSRMMDASLGLATGHLKSVSKAYSINAIHSTGAFHPKLTFLVGEDSIMLLYGSGNLTNGGFGKNHELFNVLLSNETDKTQLPLIQEAWDYLKMLTKNVEGISSSKIDWAETNCNLLGVSTKSKNSFLKLNKVELAMLYNDNTNSFSKLQELVRPKDIKAIKIYSPFYDENGAFLEQLSLYYVNAEISVYLQSEQGVHPHKMPENRRISFYKWESLKRGKSNLSKRLHSKIIWFEGKEISYCLMGSHNATIKAFGSGINKAANDEFSMLYKFNNTNLLKTLGLVGKNKKAIRQEVVSEVADLGSRESIGAKIKLLSVDQDRSRLTVYSDISPSSTTVWLGLFDSWGVLISQIELKKTDRKLVLDIPEKTIQEKISFVQFIDDQSIGLSNKQLVNNLDFLLNTNPSNANRALLRLSSLLETGDNRQFDVINFYNTLQSGVKTQYTQSNSGVVSLKKEVLDNDLSSSLSYHEAISLELTKKEFSRISLQHNSVRIWDSIQRFFTELVESEESEAIDDEEEGNAEDSRERDEDSTKQSVYNVYSANVLKKEQKAFEQFFSDYLDVLDSRVKKEDSTIGLIDLAMLLIVSRQILGITEKNVAFKKAESRQEMILPFNAAVDDMNNYNSVLLYFVGTLVSFFSNSLFDTFEDKFTQSKFDHYKQLTILTLLYMLSSAKQRLNHFDIYVEWYDLLAYNVIHQLGVVEGDFQPELLRLEKSSSIENISLELCKSHIEEWTDDLSLILESEVHFLSPKHGIAKIIKRIPKTGEVKFLQLARPGFDFDENSKDFIYYKLVSPHTGKELESSKNA